MQPKAIKKGMEDSENVSAVNVYDTMGTLTEFKIDGRWNLYQEKMKQYFFAYMIPKERKVQLLINLIGEYDFKRCVRSCKSSGAYVCKTMFST